MVTPGSTSSGAPPSARAPDEGHEEVVHAVAELLHVGVLVGGALVAVDGEPLVDPVAVAGRALAERLHDELLQVAARRGAAGPCRAAPPCPCRPRRRWRGTSRAPAARPGWRAARRRRVASSMAAAPASRPSMSSPCSAAGSRPTAESTLVRPPTQSHIGKRASQPSATAGLVERRADAGDGHGVPGEVEAGGAEGGRGGQHAVARLRRAAALGDDHDERLGERGPEPREGAGDAVRVGVVEEVGRQPVLAGLAEGVGHELGPSAEPPMPMQRSRREGARRPAGGPGRRGPRRRRP